MKSMMSRLAGLAFLSCSLLASTAVLAQGKGESVKLQDYPGTGNMLLRVAISKG